MLRVSFGLIRPFHWKYVSAFSRSL